MSATRRRDAHQDKPRFICWLCGQVWRKHPATVVGCPRCYQPAGSPCLRPSGHEPPGGIPHVEREQRALDEGLLQLCPEGPTAKGLKGAA